MVGDGLRRRARRLWDDPRARMRARGALRRPYWRWRFHSFGVGSVLVKPVWLMGPQAMHIGDQVQIHPGVWLAVERQAWVGGEPALRIGSGVVVRQSSTISCAERIDIEDGVGIGSGVLVMDSDHTWMDGALSITGNRLVTEPIQIGAGTMIGDGAKVLRGTRLGACCLVAANCVVRGEFPAFSIIAGVPGRVVGDTREHMAESLPEELAPRIPDTTEELEAR